MTQTAPPIVGRDEELKRLRDLADEVSAGSPRFVQVTGEPGIGKTYLLAEFGRLADRDGWLVLSGRCSELERELPFGLVIDTFDAYLASLDPRDFDRVAADELSELAGLFPSLRSLVPTPDEPRTATERVRAHRAVVEMLERLGARQPLLLLLDDLHWADPASIEQAAYTFRRPPQAPVMIVGSFRPGQADPGLVAAVEGAAREGVVDFVELGPIDRATADELLDGRPDNDRLYEQSGGNPFYLLQLARSEHSGQAAAIPAGAGSEGVPTAVSAAIAGELAHLPDPARRLADAASVAGDPFELDVAAATAGLADPDALDAIDGLIAADLVRTTAIPRRFQFRHPLVRNAIYEACSPGARLSAHQRAAEVLAGRGAPASERAHHVEHAARHGDTEAVEVLREAGEEAAARAPAAAARWFETALRLLPATASDAERLGLLMPLAGAQAAVGHLEDARATLVEAIPLATGDGPVPRVRVIAACAVMEELLGRRAAAHERLMVALEEVPATDPADAASLMIDLAVDGFFGADFQAMVDWALKALELARPLGDPALTAAAAATAAFGVSCTGPVARADELRSEAATLVDAMTDEQLATRLDATQWLSACEFYVDRFAESEAHSRRGLELARATGQGELVPGLIQALGNVLFTTGRPVEAGELLDGVVDAARLTDNAVSLAWSLVNRAYAALLEGDVPTARAAAEEAVEVTEELADSPVGAWAGGILTAVLLEEREPVRALAVITRRSGGVEAPAIPGAWRAVWLMWVTRCFVALDRIDDASAAAARSRARAEEFNLPVARSAASSAEAMVALAAGDHAVAAEKALDAAGLADATGARLDAARCWVLAGRAFTAAGDVDAAATQLERAAAEFDACQAYRYRDQAERGLGKLGKRTHRRSRPAKAGGEGVESLTGRELEVARLVVDRRTNPEIAAELFLSVKTVETHMRNIFRKLDVDSRVEVARVVEAHDSGRK